MSISLVDAVNSIENNFSFSAERETEIMDLFKLYAVDNEAARLVIRGNSTFVQIYDAHLKRYELAFDRRSYVSPPEGELRIISSFMDCVGREIGFEKDLSKILGIALLGGTVGAGGMIGTSFVSANMTRREMIGTIAGSVAAGLGIGFAYENFKIKNGLNEALKNAGYLDRIYLRVSHS